MCTPEPSPAPTPAHTRGHGKVGLRLQIVNNRMEKSKYSKEAMQLAKIILFSFNFSLVDIICIKKMLNNSLRFPAIIIHV